MIPSTFFALLSASAVLAAPSPTLDSKLVGECSYDELSKCDQGIALFLNDKSVPITKEDKALRCEAQSNSVKCYQNFGQKCISSLEKGLYLVLIDSLKEEVDDRCSEGSPEFKRYEDNIECVSKVPGVSKCFRTAVLGLEWITKEVELKDQIKTVCCIYPELTKCLKNEVTPVCGNEAYESTEKVVSKYFTELLDVACHKHKKQSCSKLPQPIPQEFTDPGTDLHFVNPLVKINHVAIKYP